MTGATIESKYSCFAESDVLKDDALNVCNCKDKDFDGTL